jgi:hypothetical protein
MKYRRKEPSVTPAGVEVKVIEGGVLSTIQLQLPGEETLPKRSTPVTDVV